MKSVLLDLFNICQTFLAEIEIISNPKSCTVEYGGSCIFSCEARCRGLQLCYEWYKDGRKLQGNIQVPLLNPGGLCLYDHSLLVGFEKAGL